MFIDSHACNDLVVCPQWMKLCCIEVSPHWLHWAWCVITQTQNSLIFWTYWFYSFDNDYFRQPVRWLCLKLNSAQGRLSFVVFFWMQICLNTKFQLQTTLKSRWYEKGSRSFESVWMRNTEPTSCPYVYFVCWRTILVPMIGTSGDVFAIHIFCIHCNTDPELSFIKNTIVC